MNQDEYGRHGPVNGDQRRRAVARAVPLPHEGHEESFALIVLVISATIAVVASTLATTLF